ncbi:Phosphoribulokinase/Uridine kinase [uncultured virus]|nr:Phosphoribulokinase/Uridine kinase [uncultured virus]
MFVVSAFIEYWFYILCFVIVALVAKADDNAKKQRNEEAVRANTLVGHDNIDNETESDYDSDSDQDYDHVCMGDTVGAMNGEAITSGNKIISKFIASRGRPIHTPYIIGIAGASGSGKSFIANVIAKAIIKLFPAMRDSVVIINQDSYYRGGDSDTNYDVPESIDFELMHQQLRELVRGNSVHTPTYDFTTHSRGLETRVVRPCEIIIVEGILVLTQERLRELFDLKVFVDANLPTQMFRRISRDINERGRNIDDVHKRYESHIWPSYEKYIKPSASYADMTIQSIKDCFVGPQIVLSHVVGILDAIERAHINQPVCEQSMLDESMLDQSLLGQSLLGQSMLLKPTLSQLMLSGSMIDGSMLGQ